MSESTANHANKKRGHGLFKAENWVRAVYMVVFFLIYSVAEMVILALAVFQMASKLVTGECNERLIDLGQSISTYTYQVMRFLTFNSEVLPYPFSDWPLPQQPPHFEPHNQSNKVTAKQESQQHLED